MNEYISFSGTYDETIDFIANTCSISRNAALKIVNCLIENPDLLDKKKEELYKEDADDKVVPGKASLMTGNANYYINIKRTTLITAFLVLGAISLKIDESDVFTKLAMGLGLPMFNKTIGFKIHEETGEKCMIRELAARKGSPASAKDLKRKIGKKCVKEYNCDYRVSGNCTCSENDIDEIFKSLFEKGALDKSGKKYMYKL